MIPYCRYAALLAESRACTKRRAHPSPHARPSATSFFSSTGGENSSVSSENQFASGSGALSQMHSAVAGSMPLREQLYSESEENAFKRSKGSNGSMGSLGSMGSMGGDGEADLLGNKMFIDSLSVCINSEYDDTTDPDASGGAGVGDGGDDLLGLDRSDSSCWRPELPPSELLDYIRMIASKRIQTDSESAQGGGMGGESANGVDERREQNSERNDKRKGKRKREQEGKRGVAEGDVDSMVASLSGSALVAVGVLVEELTRELIVTWRKIHAEAMKNKRLRARYQENCGKNNDNKNNFKDNTNNVNNVNSTNNSKNTSDAQKSITAAPLGPATKRAVRIEARLQLQGANFAFIDESVNGSRGKSVNDSMGKSVNEYGDESVGGGEAENDERMSGQVTNDRVTPELLRNRLEVQKQYCFAW